jgi:F-type H+-transporting ATPase subunit b
MSIDWITVGAQIANFLVLVWLLKTLLYRPILDGIDAREAEITARMDEAMQAKKQAEAVQQSFADKTKALNLAQADLSETIRKKAEEQRDILLADAKTRLEQERIAWQAHLDDEARKYITKLHSAGAGAVLSMTRKALIDLSDETLEARMAQHLIEKMKPMAADLRRAAGATKTAVITSHGALPAPVQALLTDDLQQLVPQITVQFTTAEGQTPGLMLRIGGAQVEWTVESYIDGLEQALKAQLVTVGDAKGASA